MGRIWESINASNQHMPTHVPIGQTASSPQCMHETVCSEEIRINMLIVQSDEYVTRLDETIPGLKGIDSYQCVTIEEK